MLYQIMCPNCGAKRLEKINDTQYYCEYCAETFFAKKIEDYTKELSKLLDMTKLEMASTAKQNLYNAVKEEYISKDEVIKWCDEVKKYIPDDFQANFYYALAKESKREVAKMLREIDVKEHFACLEALITVVIKSLEKSYVTPAKDLIERAFKNNSANLAKYSKYTSWIEDEAEKLDDFIYDVNIERDAFVAYSSKDRETVLEVVDYLESEGFTCFVSMRNLRHGIGAQEKYEKFLKKAMDNCTSFIFISSMNSRDRDCDALRIEIPYIMECDKANAPASMRNVYSRISYEYKKPRVEYRIQESDYRRMADNVVNNFFDGYEITYTLEDVAARLWQQTTGIDDPSMFLPKAPATQPVVMEKPQPVQSILPESSEGLEFELNEDGKSYTLTKVGSCKEKDIVIGTYKGLPVTSIGDCAFEGCSNLTSITIPNSVTSIGESAFSWCLNLTSITILGSVISIGEHAFSWCLNLTSITIPNSVTSIGYWAFYPCNNLTSIYCFNNFDNISNIQNAGIPKNATKFYYSDSRPTSTNGKRYWRYVNGVPTEW